MTRLPAIPAAPRAIQKGVPLKRLLDESAIQCLALNIRYVDSDFKANDFYDACIQGLEPLSLMERGKHIAINLRQFLPKNYTDAVTMLVASFTPETPFSEEFGLAGFFYLPHSFFISEYGLSQVHNDGIDPFGVSM